MAKLGRGGKLERERLVAVVAVDFVDRARDLRAARLRREGSCGAREILREILCEIL